LTIRLPLVASAHRSLRLREERSVHRKTEIRIDELTAQTDKLMASLGEKLHVRAPTINGNPRGLQVICVSADHSCFTHTFTHVRVDPHATLLLAHHFSSFRLL